MGPFLATHAWKHSYCTLTLLIPPPAPQNDLPYTDPKGEKKTNSFMVCLLRPADLIGRSYIFSMFHHSPRWYLTTVEIVKLLQWCHFFFFFDKLSCNVALILKIIIVQAKKKKKKKKLCVRINTFNLNQGPSQKFSC